MVDGGGTEPLRHVVGAEDHDVLAVGLRSGHRHVLLPICHVDEPVPELRRRRAQTNDDFGAGTRTTFQPLTAAQSNIWQKYSTHFGEQPGYPFLDFENKIFVLGPSYVPAVLQSLDQQEIAAKFGQPQ